MYEITSAAMATGQKRNNATAQGCSTATEDDSILYNTQCDGTRQISIVRTGVMDVYRHTHGRYPIPKAVSQHS